MNKKNNEGFTLVELLVVISIIGLLSSFAVVSLNSARAKARDALRKGDMAQIRTALNLYYDDHTHYPTNTTPDCDNWNASAADFGATPNQAGATCYSEVLGTELTAGTRPYLGSIPKDPRNTDNLEAVSNQLLYRYVSNPSGSEYAIVYQLEENSGVDQVIRGW
jgi:prepilin-type N-terminal cleavage/methylation domain-containing protein